MREGEPRRISSTNTEVVDRLVDGSMRPVREQLLNQMIENDIRLVVVFGEPNVGKTVIANQLGTALIEESGGEKRPTYYSFEELIPGMEKEFRLPIQRWGDKLWGRFSKRLFEVIENDKLPNLGPDEILIVESVSVGKTDRGLSTIRELGRKHKVDAFFLPVIGDPRLRKRSNAIRGEVLERDENGGYKIPDEELVEHYRKHNILIGGLETLSAQEAGSVIRRRVEQMDFGMEDFSDKEYDVRRENEIIQSRTRHLRNVESKRTKLREARKKGKLREAEANENLELTQDLARSYVHDWSSIAVPRLPGDDAFDEAIRKKQALPLVALMHESNQTKHRFIPVFNTYIEDQPVHWNLGS